MVAQGGVFFHQAGQCAADLALVALLGHSDGHEQAGLREDGGRQLDHAGGVAEGVAGLGADQLCHGADVTGTDALGLGQVLQWC